jgi:hypothetical protein
VKANFFHEKAMAGDIEDENSEMKIICGARMTHRRDHFKLKAKEYYSKKIVFRKGNDDFMTEHEIYITSSEEENEIQFKFGEKSGPKVEKGKSDQKNGGRSGPGGKVSMEDKKRNAAEKGRSNSTGAARSGSKGLPTKGGRATTQPRPRSGVENLNQDYFQTHNSPNRCPDAFFRLNPKKNLTLVTRSEPDTGLKVLNHKQVSVT